MDGPERERDRMSGMWSRATPAQQRGRAKWNDRRSERVRRLRDALVWSRGDRGNQCAICDQKTERLVVDHDHACRTGHGVKEQCPECVRGLLCDRCNRVLGEVGDDPELLVRMGGYLESRALAQPLITAMVRTHMELDGFWHDPLALTRALDIMYDAAPDDPVWEQVGYEPTPRFQA